MSSRIKRNEDSLRDLYSFSVAAVQIITNRAAQNNTNLSSGSSVGQNPGHLLAFLLQVLQGPDPGVSEPGYYLKPVRVESAAKLTQVFGRTCLRLEG